MFLVWGNKWQYEVKPGGLRVGKVCPECDRKGEFYEVKPVNYFTAYFIPLFEMESKRTVLECPGCKSHFYIHESDYISAKKDSKKAAAGDSGREPKGHKSSESQEKPQKPEQTVKQENKVIVECDDCYKQFRVPLMEQLIRVRCPSCSKELHIASGEVI